MRKRSGIHHESFVRQLVQHLIDRESDANADAPGRASATALAVENLHHALSRWIGVDGCHALFSRALADARREHPALGELRLFARNEPYIGNVAECVKKSGDAATADGLAAMLAAAVDLLVRLIGNDMTTNLIGQSLRDPATIAGPEKRRAEG